VVFEINFSVCFIQSNGHMLAGGKLSEYNVGLDDVRSNAEPVRNQFQIEDLPSLIRWPFQE
jgi:hypothetical protein